MEQRDTITPSGKTVTDPRGQGQPTPTRQAQAEFPQQPGGGGAPGTGEQPATESAEAKNQRDNGRKGPTQTGTAG